MSIKYIAINANLIKRRDIMLIMLNVADMHYADRVRI